MHDDELWKPILGIMCAILLFGFAIYRCVDCKSSTCPEGQKPIYSEGGCFCATEPVR